MARRNRARVVGASFSPEDAAVSFKGTVPIEISKILIIDIFFGSAGAPIAPVDIGFYLDEKWASQRGLREL